MYEITMVEVPSQLVIGLQKRGRYHEIGPAIGTVVQYGMSHGAEFTGGPIALMHEIGKDAAVKADQEGNAVIDVAFPIARPVESSETVKCYELPGGQMAKVVHQGPYEACEPAYDALYAWVIENGYMISDPTREIYLNDPREVLPEELLTELYAPVVRA